MRSTNARLFAQAALQQSMNALYASGIAPQTLKSHRPYTMTFVDSATQRTVAAWDRGDGLAAAASLTPGIVKLIEAYILLYTAVHD